MAKVLLEMKNITKTFPGVKALDNVNLKVEEGEIHALVGENGAGKSTLMNVLSGIYPYGTYEGDIIYNGEVCKFNKIKDSEQKGIVMIHQELALVPYMSIGENMFLGNEQGKKSAIDWDKTDREYVIARIEIRVIPMRDHGFDEIARTIYSFDEVETCYLMSGGYDLAVTVSGKSFKDVALFVSQKLAPIDAVQSTATHFVLKKYKERGVLLAEKERDMREDAVL